MGVHILCGLVLVAAVLWLRPRRELTAVIAAALVLGLAGTLGALFWRETNFHAIRLFAWVVFLYIPLWLLIAAGMLGKRRRRGAIFLVLVVIAVEAIAVDAFLIEPYRLEVSRFSLPSEELEETVRVAILADLQTDVIGAFEREVFAALAATEPDLLLLPGDFLQVGDPALRARLQDELRALFAALPLTTLPAVAVGGNTDDASWPRIFSGLPVEVCTGTRTMRLGIGADSLTVTGLSLRDSFDTGLQLAARPGYTIVVGHGPDFALGQVEADLLVAGHTHGGQVQLPLIGPLLTLSRIPRAWAEGVTALDRGRHLVVSRGVGMERGHAPRLRFLCRPQLVVLDIIPTARGE